MLKSTFQPIIRDAECWTRKASSDHFEREGTLSGQASAEVDKLIDRVVADQSPGILHREKHFPDTAYDSSGRRAAVGIPIIEKGNVESILVLFVECSTSTTGAIEVWDRDRQRDELGLRGAVFSKLGRFANVSHFVRFPRGSGLPGQCWDDRQAKLVTDLGASSDFMRAAGARAGGLDVGIAFPVMTTEHDLNSVVLFLSSNSSPIARVIEMWDVSSDAQSIHLRTSAHSSCEAFGDGTSDLHYGLGEGLVGTTWATGKPLLSADVATFDSQRSEVCAESGITSAITIPVFVGEFLKSVIVMFN